MNIYNYIENNREIINKINPLDALILVRLSYIKIEDLEDKIPFTIADLGEYISLIKVNSYDKKLVELISKNPRFASLEIIRISNILDEKKEEQFFAMTIKLDKKNNFIAFRGTNKSIIGLKEDPGA